MNRLKIMAVEGTWAVDFSGDDSREEIERLFGTEIVPTPYTTLTPRERVVAAIQRQNPGCTVS